MGATAMFAARLVLLFLTLAPTDAFRMGQEVKSKSSGTVSDGIGSIEGISALLFEDDEPYTKRHEQNRLSLVPLQDTLKTQFHIPTVDESGRRSSKPNDPTAYWYNKHIHTLGNSGFLGGLHAAMAPVATKVIDDTAYDGVNSRLRVSQQLRDLVDKPGARVVDMCSGVGTSTTALLRAFHDAQAVIGLDASPEMIAMAREISRHRAVTKVHFGWISLLWDKLGSWLKHRESSSQYLTSTTSRVATHYIQGNAEKTNFPDQSFDLVTFMFAFHEAPRHGRYLMLREARRLLANGGTVAILDISPTYNAGASMLAGEPFVLEYQENIDEQIAALRGFTNARRQVVVPGHLVLWTMTRKTD